MTLDFETKPTYSVTVEVHDGRDGSGNTSTDRRRHAKAVTITIENVEEPGVVTLSTDTGTIQARVPVDRGRSTMTTVPPASPGNGPARATARPPWVNIPGATSTPCTRQRWRRTQRNYIRAIGQSYTDGHGPNKTADESIVPASATRPPVNSAPAFPSTENGQREAPENITGGTSIGDPVAATDLNAGDSAGNDPLAYSLTGTDAASFTIDASTGQMQARVRASMLDYEGKRTYRFTVLVTDGSEPARRRRHGRHRRQAECDYYGDQRQRSARGHRR